MKDTIKKILCAGFILILAPQENLLAQKMAEPVVRDVLRPCTEIHLEGYLAGKLDGSLDNRILAQDVDRLIEPFKPQNRTESRLWQSEFWGKWLTSAVSAYRYRPDSRLKQVLDDAVTGLLATQSSDGYIGNYAKDKRLQQWDIWGQKYCMLGLLAYHGLTKNKKALIGASRLADNLISVLNQQGGMIVSKGNYRGMAASSVLEPICLLYTYTREKKYLDFAKEIVRQWETQEGPQLISKSNVNVGERFPKPKNWYSPEQGQKAYEMMSCYEGLLELYRLTGNESYRKAVEETWDNIRNTEINIVGSGASTEMWFGGKAIQDQPINHYQETCVTVTWLKLCEQLLRLTGNVKYADESEKTYYNALLGSMSADGAVWAKYTPLNGQRLPGSEQCGMGLNCCEANGPRGLFSLPGYMVMERNEGLQVNHFSQGVYLSKSPGGQKVTVTQRTDYPQSGNIDIYPAMARPETFEITLRIPEWSKSTSIKVNGEFIHGIQPGQLAKISRTWRTGDKISLELDMNGQLIKVGNSIAIKRGPIVLARDSRFEGLDIEAILKPVVDEKGYVELTRISGGQDACFMNFQASFIPESYTEQAMGPVKVALCDYSSAGNGKIHSYYKVWMAQLFNPSK